MPVQFSKDKKGTFCRWGLHGKPYYYHSIKTRQLAYNKALRQAKAIFAHKRL